MSALAAGLIGSIVGAVVTGVIAYILDRRKFIDERAWEGVQSVSGKLATIFDAQGIDRTKTSADVDALEDLWGPEGLNFDILHSIDVGRDVSAVVSEYLKLLRAFVTGFPAPRRDELEERRRQLWRKAAARLSRYMQSGR